MARPSSSAKAPALSGKYVFGIVSVLLVGASLMLGRGAVAESAVKIPPPAVDAPAASVQSQTAVFAGGCFWGIQAVFQHTKGVIQAVSGYSGGEKKTAEYETVSTGTTGHAESVEVTFDPKQVSYGKLLQIYFSVAHDPTQLNQQFPDSGTQYRSALFVKDAKQQEVAQKYIAQLNAAHVYKDKIVTQVTPFKAFYPAEGYHQDYATLHPTQPYIATYDLPKLTHLKAMFPDAYRDAPALVAQASAKK